MNNVKKAFVELVELLEANENKKVGTLMPQILEMVSAKSNTKTFHKIDDEVVAIYCYYHKKWELISEVEFGKKASTSHGYNTMCKQGVSNWTKQQREAKKAKELLLDGIAKGSIDPTTLNDKLEAIEAERISIKDDEQGFETLEEALNFNA